MSKRYYRISLLLTAAVLLTAGASVAAQRGKAVRGEPIMITSNRMEADKLGDKVTFTGNVTLKKEGMTLSSDSMVVYYDAGSKGIREVQAHGNVVVRKEGRVALSNDASYFSREEKIILTGEARIIENESQIGGERIILFLHDDRSIVEGGKVLLYQDKQENPPAARQRK